MPIQINYLDDGIGVEFLSTGVVTGKEIIEANAKVYTEEILPRLKYKIADRTACREYIVSAEEVKILADQDRRASTINPKMIIALVSSTDLQYGLSRMWEGYTFDLDFKKMVFRDRKSADEWIQQQLAITGSVQNESH